MGLTVHWIESNPETSKWMLCSEVITFWAIFGRHNGHNLGCYFIGLCEHAGLIDHMTSKVHRSDLWFLSIVIIDPSDLCQLFCITADNMGNNDTTCDNIEAILTRHGISTFNAGQHRLPCLAHVINLAITSIMSQVMKIANIETSTMIWEFDPNLLSNCLQGNSLDVVPAIRMLAIKIQASDQCISYFERLQVECRIDKPLKILLHSNVQWGTAYGMLE